MKSEENFTEQQIRPKNLVDDIQKFVKKDIAFLQSKAPFFKKVKCPACNKDKSKNYLTKKKFNYQICNYCETFYISPRPTLKILESYYKKSLSNIYWNNYIFPKTEKIRSKKIFHPRLKKIINLCKKHKIKNPSIMEVGAGFGSFCHLAKKSNFFSDILAIEPSPIGAKNCLKKKITVFQGLVEKLKSKKKFDIVVNFEVLEHLFSPKFFLLAMRKFLKKDGLIMLTCPNGMGFDIQMLKINSDSIDHEHLNYFNTKSIQILFKKSGYKILKVFTPGKLDVDIIKNKISEKKYKIKNNNFLVQLFNKNNELLAKNFQEFLVKNNLSSNMCVIAKIVK